MKDKFIVVYRKENDVAVSHNIYKSYREIVLATGEDYSDVRTIHMMGNGTMIKKFLHTRLKKLKNRMEIIDI
jgi:hypothetical protein